MLPPITVLITFYFTLTSLFSTRSRWLFGLSRALLPARIDSTALVEVGLTGPELAASPAAPAPSEPPTHSPPALLLQQGAALWQPHLGGRLDIRGNGCAPLDDHHHIGDSTQSPSPVPLPHHHRRVQHHREEPPDHHDPAEHSDTNDNCEEVDPDVGAEGDRNPGGRCQSVEPIDAEGNADVGGDGDDEAADDENDLVRSTNVEPNFATTDTRVPGVGTGVGDEDSISALQQMTSWHEHRYASPPKSPTPHFIVDILGIQKRAVSTAHSANRPLNLVAIDGDCSNSPPCSPPLRQHAGNLQQRHQQVAVEALAGAGQPGNHPSHLLGAFFQNGGSTKNTGAPSPLPAHVAPRGLTFDDEKGTKLILLDHTTE